LSVAGRAQPPTEASAVEGEIVPLWPPGKPGGAPKLELRATGAAGDRVLTGITTPSLSVHRPAKPDGSALLIVPGGGYMEERIDSEGIEIARRFAQDGVTAFVLTYRLPSEGWPQGPATPLEDALRAMRKIRASASRYRIDPARIGAIGFSAGGHLVAG